MEMRGLMGGFYKISEWIMRLSVTNVLWIVTSLPVWLVLLTFFTSAGQFSEEELNGFFLQTMILIGILSPFTLFPSTSAMFSLARKWVTGDVDVPLFKTFFRSYRDNYKQAMLGGLIYAALFVVLIVDYRLYLQDVAGLGFLSLLFLFLMILLLVSLLYFFSLVSHFYMKTFQLIKNALLLTIGRPIRTLMMAVSTVAILWISTRFTFLIPFFMGSLIAVVVYYNFNLAMEKMKEMAEKAAASEMTAEEAELAEEEQDKKS